MPSSEHRSAGSPDPGSSNPSRHDHPTRVSDGARDPARELPADERPSIEGYSLHEELHRGGQGVVYRATQLGTKQTVALKVLLEGPFASETARMRFEREVELAASLRHPSIVSILDSGISRGRYYFAMEYIDGVRLDQYLRAQRPGIRPTLELLEQIATTVNFAHQRGVIHRDLKPSNILITQDGVPHVLDFGLAKSAADSDPRQTTVRILSTTGQVLGTLAYMSPEQARGSQDVDVRSDAYALGVLAYEALLGRTPYDVNGPLGEVLTRIVQQDPIRPRLARSDSRFGRLVDDELETILLKSLEKAPERRYQTAGDLARDLRHYLNNEPIEAKRASGLYLLRKLLRRYRLQASAAALVLSTLVVCLIVVAYGYRQEHQLRREFEALEHQAQIDAEQARVSRGLALEAEAREREARRRAEQNESRALLTTEQLRAALIEQMVQRGRLATLSGDLAVARDSFWEAYLDGADKAAARWALRRYYLDSGEQRAVQLSYEPKAPTALSPDGALAVIADGAGGAAVRDARTGVLVRWLATPGAVAVLDIGDDGELAAAGDGWLAWWRPQALRTEAAVSLNDATPRSIDLDRSHDRVVITTDTEIRVFDWKTAREIGRAKLRGTDARRAALSPDGHLLVVPTGVGLEGFRIDAEGAPRAELLWRQDGESRATATCFADADRIYLLAGDIYVATIDGPDLKWERQVRLREHFDYLDVEPGSGDLLIAAEDGRVATVHERRLQRFWRVSLGGLRHAQWAPGGTAVSTLDERNVLTLWSAMPPSYQTVLHEKPVDHWVRAEGGAGLTWIDQGGEIGVFAPEIFKMAQRIALPGLLSSITGRDPQETRLAIDADASDVFIQSGQRLWHRTVRRPRPMAVRWRPPPKTQTREIQLAWDASVAAFHAVSDAQDRQVVAFHLLRQGARRAARGPEPWRMVEFIGSTIQKIGFVPHTYTLLVARSNGDLILLDPPMEDDRAQTRDATQPWLTLPAPAYQFAFSRDGDRLAVACEDNRVRILDVLDGAELGQIHLSARASSVDFNAARDVLLVRLNTGLLELYELERLQQIGSWALDGADGHPLAAWIGGADDIVWTGPNGMIHVTFTEADQAVLLNEAFAHQREISRLLAAGDLSGARQSAEQLRFANPALGATAARDLLAVLLRSRLGDLPYEWIDTVLDEADPSTRLRLAHAAYAGGRFELAQRGLLAAGASTTDDTDSYSAWRLAECTYLLGSYEAADDALAQLLRRTDLAAGDLPRMRLERLAALVFSGRIEQAHQVFERYKTLSNSSDDRETVGMMATLLIGNHLLGNQEQTQLDTSSRAFLNVFKEQWLDYRDDIEFFVGELARMRGDVRAARSQYQLCIDSARDVWPADWARLRLEQMDAGIASGTPE